MYDLAGKVAFITGAGSEHGMGRAIANRLAHEGADIAVNDISKTPTSTTLQIGVVSIKSSRK